MPQISVVIPTFGRPDLVGRAVASALAQTFTDIEVIVVIDGADPATSAALASIDDPRLRVIVRPEQGGAGHARDAGALAGQGRWIAFLDDDDEWSPEKLERQIAVAPDGPAVVVARSRVVTPAGTFERPAAAYDGSVPIDEWLFDRPVWLKGGAGFLQTSSLMVPRAMFERLSFGDARHEEWELAIRAVKDLGYPLITAPELLVTHYDGFARPSLSKAYPWRRSLEWADRMGPLLTRRAYAGFLLVTVARSAAALGTREAFGPLLRAAMRHGRPTARQLFAFALIAGVPDGARRRLRARTSAAAPPHP
jgi:glycosyltransferase involved in cell wall biosynthesis